MFDDYWTYAWGGYPTLNQLLISHKGLSILSEVYVFSAVVVLEMDQSNPCLVLLLYSTAL